MSNNTNLVKRLICRSSRLTMFHDFDYIFVRFFYSYFFSNIWRDWLFEIFMNEIVCLIKSICVGLWNKNYLFELWGVWIFIHFFSVDFSWFFDCPQFWNLFFQKFKLDRIFDQTFIISVWYQKLIICQFPSEINSAHQRNNAIRFNIYFG